MKKTLVTLVLVEVGIKLIIAKIMFVIRRHALMVVLATSRMVLPTVHVQMDS